MPARSRCATTRRRSATYCYCTDSYPYSGPCRSDLQPRDAPQLPAGLIALALLWAWAAHALWSSSVPAGLRLAHVDPRTVFGAAFLRRSGTYERLLAVDHLLRS